MQIVLWQFDQPILRINMIDLRHHHFNVSLPAEDGAQWSGDPVTREETRGNLIQQRAKKMVVALVLESLEQGLSPNRELY